jgi:hypothetical protein
MVRACAEDYSGTIEIKAVAIARQSNRCSMTEGPPRRSYRDPQDG